ncbi:Endonuclease/exonuclease/phosphatase [Nitrococcus mobilis Nb-231]|uniref:Endonuclease/exonuclease/phosphatase n=2 Tax=Nitrococcus mobilis TaxID=35797 RepID=A4BNX8_9GAMM|nr:Endonuclease/exonuclease/phosphatase [Nitrococcus mobilis Nb-231]
MQANVNSSTMFDKESLIVDGNDGRQASGERCLRLMTYNIQTGIETRFYHHYITRSWRHLLPDNNRLSNLDRIGGLIADFDIVGLQEIDAGSLRSGFINQAAYLAQRGGFPFWHFQTNRRIGRLARHSNGVLSRFRPLEVRNHRLPGMIPGRGALHLRFGGPAEGLDVVLLHLALGQRTRLRQLAYVAELVNACRHVIVMGDLNCLSRSVEFDYLDKHTDLCEPIHNLHTYPSWRPHRNIDHILVSPTLQVRSAEALNYPLSDHLPVIMEVELPECVMLVE